MIRIPSYLKSDVCLGIHINNTSVQAVAIDQTSSPYQPLWSSRVLSDVPLLTDTDNYSALKDKLSELVCSVAGYSSGEIPIQLAIADPVLSNYFLEFESFPKNSEERVSLISWQLSKQYHVDCEKLALTFQDMGEHAGKHLVFVLGIERLLIDTIMDVFMEADVAITVLDASASYLYNVLPRVVPSKNAMAINMEDAYWTIIIWDENSRIQYLRSKWHDGETGLSNSYQEINKEIERTARAFVQQKDGRSIKAIHLCGDETYTSALKAQFHKDVREHCTTHLSDELFTKDAVNREHSGWALLAASLCRNS